jgi:hypothetical protein
MVVGVETRYFEMRLENRRFPDPTYDILQEAKKQVRMVRENL